MEKSDVRVQLVQPRRKVPFPCVREGLVVLCIGEQGQNIDTGLRRCCLWDVRWRRRASSC